MADELLNNAVPSAPAIAPDLQTDPEAEFYFDFINKHFNALPEPVRQYLNSSRVADELRDIYQADNLTVDERDLAYAVVLQVFFGLVKPADLDGELQTELNWAASEAERRRRLALALIGRILLPAQGYLGDLTPLLVEFGGRVEDFPNEQIELRVVTFDEGAKEIAAAVKLPLEPADRLRLQHIIATHLRDVRDEMETREMLTRPKKVGGMELEDLAVEHIFTIIKEKAKLTKYVEYVDNEPVADQSVIVTPAGETVEPPPTPSPTPVPPPASAPAPALAPAPAKSAVTPAEIKAIYNGPDEERAALVKRITKFKEVTASDPLRERDAFYEILYPPDLGPVERYFVVAAVLTMADDGTLVKTLTEDLRCREIINKYLVDQQLQSAAFRFAEKPGDAEFMNVFLQLVLRGFAELSEEAAARFGLRASRAMSRAGYPEYEGFVAFDADTRAFRWLKPIDL
jgi:hypothetical protein